MLRRAGVVFALGLALALVVGACGSDSGSGGAPATKAAWLDEYGGRVEAVDAALDKTQAATKNGEPIGIRTNCEGLRDTVAEAKQTPAVPDAEADKALRAALDAVGRASADCLRAILSGDTPLLERSIAATREARLALDGANAKLRA